MRVQRCDSGTIFKHQFTPEGYLRCFLNVGKVGDLRYLERDGTERIERVSPEVLFEKAHLDSLKMKPIVREHPEGVDRLDSTNTLPYQRGMTGHNVIIDGDFLGIVGTVVDQELIDEIVSGKRRGCSLGYDCEVVPRKDGTYEQLSRRVNHIAICENPRAGEGVQVKLGTRLDSMKKYQFTEDELNQLVKDAIAVKESMCSREDMEEMDDEDEEMEMEMSKRKKRKDMDDEDELTEDMDDEDELTEDMDDEDELTEDMDDEDELTEDMDDEDEPLTREDSLVNDAFYAQLQMHRANSRYRAAKTRADSLAKELRRRRDSEIRPCDVINEWEGIRAIVAGLHQDAADEIDGLEINEDGSYEMEDGMTVSDIKAALLKAAGIDIDYNDPGAVDVAYQVMKSGVMGGTIMPPSAFDTFKAVASAMRCDTASAPRSSEAAREELMRKTREMGRTSPNRGN